MKAILIDLDGVIYENARIIPGAIDTLRWLQQEQIPWLFITNTTSRSRSELVEKLSAMGMDIEVDRILTPPVAALAYMQSRKTRDIALFVPPSLRDEFSGMDCRQPDLATAVSAIVLGDLGDDWTFTRLNQAFHLLMDNPEAELIALGMTRYWRGPSGLQLDVGPFVQALSYATGREPVVMGKPAAAFFTQAVRMLGAEPSQVCMIGDDLQSDVLAAEAAGIRGILVRTGKYRVDDEKRLPPDRIMNSIADLPLGWAIFQASH